MKRLVLCKLIRGLALSTGVTLTFWSMETFAADLSAMELVTRAEKQVKGDSFKGQMKMTVDKAGSKRTLELRVWLKGDRYSLVKVLGPVKDRGTGTLRIGLELWQYLAKVDRIVRIPPSMMLQSWMGSDFSNDDLVKSTSLGRDYTHKTLHRETVNGEKAIAVECTPKKDAPIVWGKVLIWVRENDQSPVKQEFYSERGQLLKTLNGSDFKTFGKRTIPTRVEMIPADSPRNRTVMEYIEAEFDRPLEDSIFSQQRLRRDGE